jgi:putative transposase
LDAPAQKALAKAQRRLARRKRGSKRREEARTQVAKLHQRVARQRADFLHKLSTRLVRENDVIVYEDLNLKGLASGMLAKSFRDVAIGMFTFMLTYKAEYAGREAVKVNPNYTSQDCSVCGHREKHPLWVREFECICCGTKHHRDTNAAINVKQKWAGSLPLGDNASVVELSVA